MVDLAALKFEFKRRYSTKPRIFRAPGRINLIGEHTDYNDGFVLPAALDFATYVAAAPRSDRKVCVASLNFDAGFEFDLDAALHPHAKTWAKYVQGVALVLDRKGYRLTGADLLVDSDVPVGAGLSSSAALEVAAAFALATLSGNTIDRMELAKIGQQAEHEFAGVRSGIMDQFASVFGQVGHALFLDCRSLESSPVPIGDATFIICNTKAKHNLAESEYNIRRTECETAASFFGRGSLRDVSESELMERSGELDEILLKRARHVITENARVLASVECLKNNDLVALGNLMTSSHESLRDDFEVSCRELDLMVDLASFRDDVLGTRMMGGGFGGSTINLMADGDHSKVASDIAVSYERETGIFPDVYECTIGHGVSEIVK